MDHIQIHECYRKGAEAALEKSTNRMIVDKSDLTQNEIDHILDIAVSVMKTRDKIQSGGSFVHSIVDNKLNETYERADETCAKAIGFFIYCNKWIQPIPKSVLEEYLNS
jgi:hypothetical protein